MKRTWRCTVLVACRGSSHLASGESKASFTRLENEITLDMREDLTHSRVVFTTPDDQWHDPQLRSQLGDKEPVET